MSQYHANWLRWIVNRRRAGLDPAPSMRRHRYYGRLFWATPPWLTDDQLRAMVQTYATRTPSQQVDHIVPLDGALVCGLNVPWNLRKMDGQANNRKSNRHWPGSPGEVEDMFGDMMPHQMSMI